MSELSFIQILLTELAPFAREKYVNRRTLTTGAKADPTDLVTEVDLGVQRMAARRIAEEFPNDVIMAEEDDLDGAAGHAPERCWVMDPIDGTYNFMRGLFPGFGISLAFVEGGEARAAGVILPMTNDLFLAERGTGARRNGRALRVSEAASLDAACIEADFGRSDRRAGLLDRGDRLLRTAGQLRCHGAAVIGLCGLAAGETDAYVHCGLQPWDYAAAQLIVEEAGGCVTRWDGSPLRVFGANHDIVASNGRLHEAVRGALGAAS